MSVSGRVQVVDSVTAAFVEIYMEKATDLLAPPVDPATRFHQLVALHPHWHYSRIERSVLPLLPPIHWGRIIWAGPPPTRRAVADGRACLRAVRYSVAASCTFVTPAPGSC